MCKKFKHRHYGDAMKHIKALRTKGKTKNGTMRIYLCPGCGYFHITSS